MNGFHDLKIRRDEWQRVLRDVAGLDCYISFSSELDLRVDGTDWLGCVAHGMFALVRECRPEIYTGPKPAMVIHDGFSADTEQLLKAIFLDSLVVHEASHLVQDQIAGRSATKVSEHFQQSARRIIETPTTVDSEPCSMSLPPWYGHGADFVRIMLHLNRRARREGVLLLDDEMQWPHEMFGLSCLQKYRAALGDEPTDRMEWSITEAVADEAPTAFTELFRMDAAKWFESQTVRIV